MPGEGRRRERGGRSGRGGRGAGRLDSSDWLASKLPGVDSISYAMARRSGAEVRAQDADGGGLPRVRFRRAV